jgi:hypothetical protein
MWCQHREFVLARLSGQAEQAEMVEQFLQPAAAEHDEPVELVAFVAPAAPFELIWQTELVELGALHTLAARQLWIAEG